MAKRDEILKLLVDRVRLKHMSIRTEECYRHWVGRYCDFLRGVSPALSSEKKMDAFLTHLARDRQVSASSQNQAFHAVRFLYEVVLDQRLGNIDALRAKRPVRERVAPSRDEVRRLLGAIKDTPGTPAKLIAGLLYGAGLRVCEPLELRIKDVLLADSHLVIRAAKGDKDRRVPMPCCLVAALKRQIERARAVWQWDRDHAPQVGVTLPGALDRKYPKAKFAWPWFWVFPSGNHCAHPRTGGIVRWRLHEASIQRAVKQAGVDAALDTWVTPHHLRHAYATHSTEDVQVIQKILGHVNIETTMGYRHREIAGASNPLDQMVEVAS